MAPSSGTGHSTSPATSSSSPASSTTVRPRAAASRVTPSQISRRRSAASTMTWRSRNASRHSAQDADRERAGREEPMPLGEVAAGQPVAVIVAVAQVERHRLAVEQAEDAAQRAHPGEGAGAAPAHRFRPGKAAQQRRAARARSARRRRCRAPPGRAPRNRLPRATARAVGAVLAQEPGQRLLGRVAARAALAAAAFRHAARHARRQGDPPRAGECADVRGAPAAPAPRRPAGTDPRPPAPACAPGFLR